MSGIVDRFRRAEIPLRASALAYYTLVGIVPIVGLVFWYLNFLGITKQWRDLLESFFLSHINVTSSPAFIDHFEKLTTAVQTRTSNLLGLAVLLYTSYNLVMKLGDSLDIIFNTDTERPSMEASFFLLMLRRTAVIVGLPLFLTLSVVVASWLQKDSWLRYLFKLTSVGSYLAIPIPALIDIFALFLVYQLIPQRPGPWKESLRAASLVGPLFAAIKFAVGLYNHKFLMSFKFYGALAAILIFIIWVQLAWMMILCGALLIRYDRGYERAPTAFPPRS